ncbi:MAG: hypothetical protein KatS3mg055_1676 [Chloroflexus sp.]|uniref:hypothetical protein n=1 Tax=Chloroflexus sp. TaxID=1904827 RepID=UPI0021DCC9F3|nr:hypothetical protein [Chloroflexus sp.]GIV89158.1 MAG: hypothetical protein KatS3mg055_1676 [Chloroflexus sp.]
MATQYLDPGIYTNIFPVQIPDETVEVMCASTNAYPSLREIREQIRASCRSIRVYRLEGIVLGYGSDLDWFADKGFERLHKRLYDYPKWCSRMIVEGLVDTLREHGYRERVGKGRTTLYEPQPFRQAAQGRLCVFRGYDLRAIFWWKEKQPLFGLIVDICWEIHDANGKRLSSPEIAQYNAVTEIAQIQEEFLPGNRINPEVSRLRLHNHVLPFVQSHCKFTLPCSKSVVATVGTVPLRVILGV